MDLRNVCINCFTRFSVPVENFATLTIQIEDEPPVKVYYLRNL